MSDTEHVLKVKIDIGLDLENTQSALYYILEAGHLNVDREFMKTRFPDMRSGPVEILGEKPSDQSSSL